MKKNLDVRAYACGKGVYMYEIAIELHIGEATLMRWLRDNLTDDRKVEIISAIDRVAASRANNAATA